MAYVVAISGPAAVGKTTLCRRLCDVLPSATYLSFDDYLTRKCFPDDVELWVREGVDFNQIKSPDFTSALHALRAGRPVPNPSPEGGEIHPADIVLTDDPFGRERAEIASALDLVIFLDLPLELGLARAIRRKAEAAKKGPLFDVITSTLDLYLAVSRPMYCKINERVRANCDLVLDGERPIAELTQEVDQFIRTRQNRAASEAQRGVVEVVPYDPRWPLLFEREAARLRGAFGDLALDIQHIGSTAVPGLASKPILDIALAVSSFEEATACIQPIEALGYVYRGENGCPRRHYFVHRNPDDAALRKIHLHVHESSSAAWQDRLVFRDALRKDSGLAAEYAHLKRSLAKMFPDASSDAYTDGKSVFVRAVVAKAKIQPVYPEDFKR